MLLTSHIERKCIKNAHLPCLCHFLMLKSLGLKEGSWESSGSKFSQKDVTVQDHVFMGFGIHKFPRIPQEDPLILSCLGSLSEAWD